MAPRRRSPTGPGDPPGDAAATLAPPLAGAFTAWGRFSATGDPYERDLAIDEARRAVQLQPPGSPRRPILLHLFLGMLWNRVMTASRLDDVLEAIPLYAELLGHGDPVMTMVAAHNLAVARLLLHGHTGDPAHAEEMARAARVLVDTAVTAAEPDVLLRGAELLDRAIAVLPAGHGDLAASHRARGTALLWWTRLSGDPCRVDAADEALRAAVTLAADDADRRAALGLLGDLAGLRVSFTRSRTDLDAALAVYREALAAHPDDDPMLPGLLLNLGTGHRTRYQGLGRRSDLEAAVRCLGLAAALATDPSVRAAAEAELRATRALETRGVSGEWRHAP